MNRAVIAAALALVACKASASAKESGSASESASAIIAPAAATPADSVRVNPLPARKIPAHPAPAPAAVTAPAPAPVAVTDQGTDAAALIQRAADLYEKTKTVTGTFAQTVDNPLTSSTLNSRGEFQQRAPDALSIRFTEPAGDRIVADGSFIWLYLPSSTPGQVIKMRQSAQGAGSVDLMRQFLTNPRERYTITDAGGAVIDSRQTRAVKLVPKSSATFTSATVWIDPKDATVRQFESNETSGLTRRVHFTALTLGGAVSSSAFSFTPPAGVKVVEQ